MKIAVVQPTENQSGQRMGPKGFKTRKRLIDATVKLLGSMPLRDLKVVDVAAQAKTSSATFYLYFNSVIDAVCVASEELSQSTPEIMALFDTPWTEANSMEKATKLVNLHLKFWEDHRPLLRVRNLAAEEGDERFLRVREDSVRPLFNALQERVRAGQRVHRVPDRAPPSAVSGTLLMMLERMGAIMHVHSSTVPIDGLKVACAQHIASAVGFPPGVKRDVM